MIIQRRVLIGFLVVVPALCLLATADCGMAGPCGLVLGHPGLWSPAVFGSAALLALWATIVLSTRLAVTIVRTNRGLRHLPRLSLPTELSTAAESVKLTRIVQISSESATAFCAGFCRPTVFVSDGALAALSPIELTAVLHHEAEHARRLEPLRRAVWSAAVDALPFLPIVRWWSEQRIEKSEVNADIVAERLSGRSAVAGALLAMSRPLDSVAAFAGQSELRARRLLGAELESQRPPRTVWIASLIYGWLAISIAGCFFEALAVLS